MIEEMHTHRKEKERRRRKRRKGLTLSSTRARPSLTSSRPKGVRSPPPPTTVTFPKATPFCGIKERGRWVGDLGG